MKQVLSEANLANARVLIEVRNERLAARDRLVLFFRLGMH